MDVCFFSFEVFLYVFVVRLRLRLKLLQRIFLSPDSSYYEESRIPLLFAIDVMTLLPPFAIIFTCTDIRHYLFPFLKKKVGL